MNRRFDMKNPTDKKPNAVDSKTNYVRDYGNDPYFVKKQIGKRPF